MNSSAQNSRAFNIRSIQSGFSQKSLFTSSYIYMSPRTMKDMGLQWGSPICVTNFTSGQTREAKAFALLSSPIDHDQVILSQEIASALQFDPNSLKTVIIRPDLSKQSLKTSKDFDLARGFRQGQVRLQTTSLPEIQPGVYRKTACYELMAFISGAELKLQVKSLIRKSYQKTFPIYHPKDINSVPLEATKILQLLHNPDRFEVIPDMGLILIRPENSACELHIELQEVHPCLSLETEMIMNNIEGIRRDMLNKSMSSIMVKDSKTESKEENEQLSEVQQLLNNLGAKSTKASQSNAYMFSPGKKLESSSDSPMPHKKITLMPTIEQEFKSLETRVLKMEEELRVIKEGQDRIYKKSEKTAKIIQEISLETNEKLNAIVKEDWLAIQKVKEHMKEVQQELTESSEHTKNLMKKMVIEMDNKIKQSVALVRYSSGSQCEKDSEQRETAQQSLSIPLSPCVDPESACLKDFSLEGAFQKTIVRRSDKSQWCQLLSKQAIDFHHKTSCSLKIVRSKFFFVMVGLIDKKLIRNRSSWTNQNCLAYCGWNGFIYVSGEQCEQNAQRFQSGTIVTMESHPQKGSITWVVDGNQNNHICPILMKKGVEWVPYIQMFSVGDVVEWR